ncbi:hypothetical protein LJC12_00545 [Odoribacter sp. OttesenSCG-928-J03]|nr:hypothetical protein [Odoribacter sp. OttesenSCG-928-J03]MDL2283367.1 hypothetical protein [Odoribacter sp. OttesenSCG-928-G04]
MRRLRLIFLLLFTSSIGSLTFGQSVVQDSVAVYMKRIAGQSNDSMRLVLSDKMVEYLEQMQAGSYDTDKSVKYLGYKKSPDADVELFSWSVPVHAENAYYSLFKFKDNRNFLLKSVPGVNNHAPSFLFFDILPFKSKGEDYYVLFGWNSKKNMDMKAIYIATFDDRSGIDFSAQLLTKGNLKSSSYTFQYAKESNLMLRHDKKGKRIIFDHLSPSEPRYEGLYGMYGPDGTYDAFLLKQGKWELTEDIKL